MKDLMIDCDKKLWEYFLGILRGDGCLSYASRHRDLRICLNPKEYTWKNTVTDLVDRCFNYPAKTYYDKYPEKLEAIKYQKYVTFVLKPSILKRDGYHCVLCNTNKVKLDCHHKSQFNYANRQK